jgi:hypothetical protein
MGSRGGRGGFCPGRSRRTCPGGCARGSWGSCKCGRNSGGRRGRFPFDDKPANHFPVSAHKNLNLIGSRPPAVHRVNAVGVPIAPCCFAGILAPGMCLITNQLTAAQPKRRPLHTYAHLIIAVYAEHLLNWILKDCLRINCKHAIILSREFQGAKSCIRVRGNDACEYGLDAYREKGRCCCCRSVGG